MLIQLAKGAIELMRINLQGIRGRRDETSDILLPSHRLFYHLASSVVDKLQITRSCFC